MVPVRDASTSSTTQLGVALVTHVFRKELCRAKRSKALCAPAVAWTEEPFNPGVLRVRRKDRYACRYLVGRQLKQTRTLNNRFLFFPAGSAPLRNTF
jgi:hypothetical protein